MYTELQVTSNFSFLRGASHPDELMYHARDLGYKSLAITDRNTLAGIVRAHSAAKDAGIRLIVGCYLQLQDGPPLLAYPTDKAAYARLSALLTVGNLRAEKGHCELYRKDVYQHKAGLIFITLPPATLNKRFDFDKEYKSHLADYKNHLGSALYLAVSRYYEGNDTKRIYGLAHLAEQMGVPLIATNDVYYHEPYRRELQDVLTCIREKCTIYTAGYRLFQNAERHLKTPQEMMRLFRRFPEAIANTQKVAAACRFSLNELKYEYPREITPKGRTPLEEITFLAWQGAKEMYGNVIPDRITANINHELAFIKEMNYACYFLTVYDIVRFARSKGILCQGRGSAANSTICYVLGITSVDPTKFDLLFERFISSARNEPPDIDVDFEHERREEVIQYIYNKYGRDRAAIVATVTQQRQKGAIRDVGKAMGLSKDIIDRLSSSIWEYSKEWFNEQRVAEQGLNPYDQHLMKVLELTGQMLAFPRQLGQHTGGFIITEGKLSDLCPVINARMENRTNIEWNKEDIEELKFLKVDVLALGMLTCIRKAFDLVRDHHGKQYTLASVPQDDPVVYDMISAADTIGVFQIESRAQQSMLPRMKPRNFYDLVIEVAIVRPGPIQGNMVHPYLRRRNGEEPVTFPSKELEGILGRTLGVPLFQEQAMKIAIIAAGFTPAAADQLRRSMATFRNNGQVSMFEHQLIQGMVKNGYTEDYARSVFKQLEGFGSYGFPESHAASFALLVYISSWLKCYYPDVFCCAILNSLPMGFYQPSQLVIDARSHGVEVRPADVNLSQWNNTLEEKTGKYCALRLGFRQINGIRQEDMESLLKGRMQPYTTLHALRDAGVQQATIEKLADADAFRSMGLDRRQALWEASAMADRPVGIFTGQASESSYEQAPELPLMTDSEHVVQDYGTTSLSVKGHPIGFLREKLSLLRICSAKELPTLPHGAYLKVAGLVLVRQRPGTAKGVCFITLEDETGVVNLVVFAKLFDKYRKEILQSRLLMVEGRLQKEGAVIHVIVSRCHNLSPMLRQLTAAQNENLPVLTLSRGDEKDGIFIPAGREMGTGSIRDEVKLPDARNFK
ncbi:error-prone DNA polymerase [Filimonas zeae]|uniref:Error-prone DNA polymerase n=1 Tax=Filimonas zeae TaxID=1737353 RepID=A0A917IZH6_9BACT|nr:error-prone DNA polymerase [Filimonas zeae]MDR6340130.1 error-prone DNA polymerase [Filimonas zeae]GGH71286.1 error-prone DNA polymerase 2 [Filimonas zeae]